MRPTANRRQGRIANRLSAKMCKFPSLSFEAPCFCLYLLKVEGAVNNFINPQRFFYFFSLSNCTTVCVFYCSMLTSFCTTQPRAFGTQDLLKVHAIFYHGFRDINFYIFYVLIACDNSVTTFMDSCIYTSKNSKMRSIKPY